MKRAHLWGALLGNVCEHFDTALYALLAPFIAPLFFPSSDPIVSLIIAYAVLPLQIFSKSLGAFVFSILGDRWSRSKTLIISLLGIGSATFVMGFLPTFQEVGLWAPLLLVACRCVQGFFASAEEVGSVIYVLERVKRQDFFSGFLDCTVIMGALFASCGVSLLHLVSSVEQSWRFLYWIGGCTAVVALVLRLQKASEERVIPERKTYTELFKEVWQHRSMVFLVALVVGFSYSSYMLAFSVVTGLAPLVTTITREQSADLNTLFYCLDIPLLLLFGGIAARYTRLRVMRMAALTTIFLGPFLLFFMDGAGWVSLFLIRLCIIALGTCFAASLHAWKVALVPPELRFRVLIIGTTLGTQLIGAPTAALSLLAYKVTGLTWTCGLYWAALALLSFVGLALLSKRDRIVAPV